jgi:hypothetical protein
LYQGLDLSRSSDTFYTSRRARHQGSPNGTTLHQRPQVPGNAEFLPKFLPKRAT